jgi:hypothetical protein
MGSSPHGGYEGRDGQQRIGSGVIGGVAGIQRLGGYGEGMAYSGWDLTHGIYRGGADLQRDGSTPWWI